MNKEKQFLKNKDKVTKYIDKVVEREGYTPKIIKHISEDKEFQKQFYTNRLKGYKN